MSELLSLSGIHLDALTTLQQRCFPSVWSEKRFTQILENPRYLILGYTVVDKLVAYIVIMRIADEAELIQIAVAPELRQQGVGNKMMSYAADMLRELECYRWMLEVRCSNQPAIALYEQQGFTADGCRKGYYPALDGAGVKEDALLMSCQLLS